MTATDRVWVLIATLAACVGAAACEGYVSKEAAANVERQHKVVLLPGYSDFRLVDSSADVGVAIFSYAYSDRGTPSEVLGTLEAQIQKADGCFRSLQQSADELQLRCPYPNRGFAEYRLMAQGGRVTAMFGDFDDPQEIASYPEYEEAFHHAASQGSS